MSFTRQLEVENGRDCLLLVARFSPPFFLMTTQWGILVVANNVLSSYAKSALTHYTSPRVHLSTSGTDGYCK